MGVENSSAETRQSARSMLPIVLAIVALAFAFRLINLGRQSLWYDEGVSAYLTTLSLPELTRWTAEDIQPPLYYYVLAGWVRLGGRSEEALRWPSLMFGVLMVPLAWYAGRRLFSPQAGVLAALLFAASPLYIWYSQEARNYTLLTCLSVLAAILVFRLSQEESRVSMWATYALVALATLYTHYFAIFLLGFHVLYFLLAWRSAGRPRRAIAWAGFTWLATVLLYLPWLPYLIGRYGQDTSYWQGTLKVGEALRKLWITFSVGESVLEPIGIPIALVFLLLLLLSWIVIAILTPQKRWSLVFLMLYLLVPVAGVLLVTLRAPKFNPRYLMPASPAYLLAFAGGIDALYHAGSPMKRRWSRLASYGLAGLVLAFILSSFAYADRNMYLDPAFTKADFRGVTNYLRAHRTSDEAIILISGHMFPVFDYYMPGVERILLPEARILSTQRVLNYAVAQELNERLAGKSGVWVVRWQDDIVDPNGMLEWLLEQAGERLPVPASFWHVGLDHYRLPGGARFPPQPPIEHPLIVNYGHFIHLVGWSQPRPDTYILFWEAPRRLAEDLAVSLRLVDEQGIVWGQEDRRPAAYLYPTTRWEPHELVLGRGVLPAEPGTPPGQYFLEVHVYTSEQIEGLDILDTAGAPQGKAVTLGPFVLSEAGRAWSAESLPPAQAINQTWADHVILHAMRELPKSVTVGEALFVELIWTCVSPTDGPLQATIRLMPSEQTGPALESPIKLMSQYPTTQWRAGEWLRSRDVVRVPASWPAGPAQVRLLVSDAAGIMVEPAVLLGELIVEAPARDFTLPPIQVPSGARAGEAIRLIGLNFEPAHPIAGEPFAVTLYWQPLRELDRSYTVFVHMLDRTGKIAAQHDRLPANGTRPTTGWIAGEVIADRYEFGALPKEGGVSLAIGLYEANRARMPRLSWTDEAGRPVGDAWHVPIPAASP